MFDKINKLNFGTKDVLDNFYFLYGEVNYDEAKGVAEWIMANNLASSENKPDCLNLMINSHGGSLTSAFSIIDMMNGSTIPCRVIASGLVASAGLLILMSGQKGLRIVSENASILSHTFSTYSEGTFHSMIADRVEQDNTQKRLIKHIKRCTGLGEGEINSKLMPATDVWLTAHEAVKMGLADTVSTLK